MPIATGTIYRIICLPEPNIQYIGSTFTTLKQRWSKHKCKYKRTKENKDHKISIHPYFDKYGIDNFKMVKIKDYKVWREHQRDTKHLCIYEQLWISKTKNVNKKNAFYIREHTRKEKHKEWVKNNLDKVKQYQQTRNEKYILIKDEINEKRREKYIHIKDKLNEKRREKHSCVCGGKYTGSQKARHERTQKHISYINSL